MHMELEALISITVPNVWVRPNNQRKEADSAKALLSVPGGDHLTLLNVYNSYRESAWLSSLRLHLSCILAYKALGRPT